MSLTWAEEAINIIAPRDMLEKLCRPQVLGGAAVVVGSMAALRWYLRRQIDRFVEVPGWPVLTFDPLRAFETFEGWASKYGSEGVFEATMAGKRMVFVCGADEVQEVAAMRPFKVTRVSDFHKIGLSERVMGLFFAEGRLWSTHRRLVAPAFNSKSLTGYLPHVCHIVDVMKRKVAEASTAGERVNVSRMFQLMSIDLITKVAFGADWGSLAGRTEEAKWVEEIMEGVLRRSLSPAPYWKVPGLARLLGDSATPAVESLRKTLAKLLDGPCEENTLLGKLVERANGEVLGREELIGNLVTVFLAGSDTTTHALAWAMYHLAQQPALQEEISAEARRLAPGDATAKAAAAGADTLALTMAVALETLRLNGPAPLLYLENTEPVTLAGRRLPAGTFLCLLMRTAALRSSSVREAFGSDLHAFRPSRWNRPDGKLVQCPPFDKLPYGIGARICVGMGFANTVMALVIAELMRDFRIERWEGVPMFERSCFVQRSAQDICVRFLSRD